MDGKEEEEVVVGSFMDSVAYQEEEEEEQESNSHSRISHNTRCSLKSLINPLQVRNGSCLR